MKMKSSTGTGCASTVFVATAAFIFVSCHVIFTLATRDTLTAEVVDKQRISTGSGTPLQHRYLVFTNAETLENPDSLLYAKFNSSDVQGQLRIGKRYEFDVYGWRLPFFSSYRNIYGFRAVEPVDTEHGR
jgi:hypothetical protein